MPHRPTTALTRHTNRPEHTTTAALLAPSHAALPSPGSPTLPSPRRAEAPAPLPSRYRSQEEGVSLTYYFCLSPQALPTAWTRPAPRGDTHPGTELHQLCSPVAFPWYSRAGGDPKMKSGGEVWLSRLINPFPSCLEKWVCCKRSSNCVCHGSLPPCCSAKRKDAEVLTNISFPFPPMDGGV